MKQWSKPEFDSSDIKKTAYGNPVSGVGEGKKLAQGASEGAGDP